jgi:hypothetical protein
MPNQNQEPDITPRQPNDPIAPIKQGEKPFRPTFDLSFGDEVDDINIAKRHPQFRKKQPNTAAASTPYSGTPKQLIGITATESPSKQQDRTVSLVTVNFTRDASDKAFGGLKVWLTGYKGNINPVSIADGRESPIQFLIESTGETVIVTGQPIGQDGSSATFDKALTTTVLLDGVISAPPAPTIAQFLTAVAFGFQFAYNQLTGLTADVIDSYKIYRNSTNDSSTATCIDTKKHDPTATGAIVVQDYPGVDKNYWYFISAVNTAGLESFRTDAQSGAVTSNQVVGTDAAPTASARDINKNLFGDPAMSVSIPGTAVQTLASILAAFTTNVEEWWQNQDGTSPTDNPEYRNHGDVRLCKVTATGGTKVAVGQHKKFSRFYIGLNYAVRLWVRINSGDAAPNGNFNIVFRAYKVDGTLISTMQTTTTPGSAITSTNQLATAYLKPFNLVAGAQYYSVEFENTSTNTDIYITQPMLNRGTEISEYTEETYLTDVAQYANEGYNFVDDGFTGANSTDLIDHNPDTAGFEWVKFTVNGTQSFQIQSNVLSAQATVVASTVYYLNSRSPLAAAYAVQADVTGLSNTDQIGVMGRFRDVNNNYRLWIDGASPTLHLDKKVAGTITSLGTFALAGSQTQTIKLVITSTGLKGYANGTLRITSADVALGYQSTERVGVIDTINATADHPTWDNFKATYLQDVSTPPSPPPGGGGGGGDPGGGGRCVVGDTLITTRSGKQTAFDLWQKFVLDGWTDADDLLTFDFETGKFDYVKPSLLWCGGVNKTYIVRLEDDTLIEGSEQHKFFSDFKADSFQPVLAMSTGDVVQKLDIKGQESKVPIAKTSEQSEQNVVYYFELPPTRCYFANDCLCHNLKP